MKRRLLQLLLILPPLVMAYAAGWRGHAMQSRSRLESERDYAEMKLHKDLTKLRQRSYGSNYFHSEGVFPEIEARLAVFDPATSNCSIILSYKGGIGGADRSLRLDGDGSLTKVRDGGTTLITKVDPERCKAFFLATLKSGILNYSEAVVGLKKDLLSPDGLRSVNDLPDSEMRISVPELGVEKLVTIYAPEFEAENYPDIIEFQAFVRIQNELQGFAPSGYPLWR